MCACPATKSKSPVMGHVFSISSGSLVVSYALVALGTPDFADILSVQGLVPSQSKVFHSVTFSGY